MLKFKRFIIFIFVLFLSCSLFACNDNNDNNENENNTPVEYTSLKIISINDMHGAIEETDYEYGIARLAKYVNDQRAVEGQAVLLLSAGDAFQGTAISNYSYGHNVVKLMNEIKFDAMTIGNHEFDWGLNTILSYVDDNPSNGEANFPFLACNIFEKETNEIPDYIDPYQIVDFGNFSVGIIGYIGVGLEEDISASMVRDYYFADPVPYVAQLSKELRTEKGCDFIIAMGHDGNTVTNGQLTELSNEFQIDTIINGHTHATYTKIYNVDDRTIPVSQAGSAGEELTDTLFSFDKNTNKFTYRSMKNVTLNYNYDPEDKIKGMVQSMTDEIAPIMNEVLAVAGKYVSKSSVAQWIADEVLNAANCHVGAINAGGVRSAAFPIKENTQITVKKVYEMYPFDNAIKVCTFTGSELIQVLKINDIVISSNVSVVGNTYYINGNPIDVNQNYRFACVDYLFDREEIIYGVGKEIEILSILVRDAAILGLKELDSEGYRWLD